MASFGGVQDTSAETDDDGSLQPPTSPFPESEAASEPPVGGAADVTSGVSSLQPPASPLGTPIGAPRPAPQSEGAKRLRALFTDDAPDYTERNSPVPQVVRVAPLNEAYDRDPVAAATAIVAPDQGQDFLRKNAPYVQQVARDNAAREERLNLLRDDKQFQFLTTVKGALPDKAKVWRDKPIASDPADRQTFGLARTGGGVGGGVDTVTQIGGVNPPTQDPVVAAANDTMRRVRRTMAMPQVTGNIILEDKTVTAILNAVTTLGDRYPSKFLKAEGRTVVWDMFIHDTGVMTKFATIVSRYVLLSYLNAGATWMPVRTRGDHEQAITDAAVQLFDKCEFDAREGHFVTKDPSDLRAPLSTFATARMSPFEMRRLLTGRF